MEYNSISVYRIKDITITSLKKQYPTVKILEDEAFINTTYIFIPEDIFYDSFKQMIPLFQGAYIDVVPGLLSEPEVDNMIARSNIKEKAYIGSMGFLDGFGSTPFYVSDVLDEEIVVVPSASNLYKPISTTTEFFTVDKEVPNFIEYSYSSEVAIDCDIFPNLDVENSYLLITYKLIRLLHTIHSMVDLARVSLVNPCPEVAYLGATLGIPLAVNKETILSDCNTPIRVSGKDFRIQHIHDVSRFDLKTDRVLLRDLNKLFELITISGALTIAETYQLLNRRYFNNNNLLDIQLSHNPAEDM